MGLWHGNDTAHLKPFQVDSILACYETPGRTGIPGVEEHTWQSITIRWLNISVWVSNVWCNTIPDILRPATGTIYSKPPKVVILKSTPYDANFWIVGNASHSGDIRCWGSCRTNYFYSMVQHTLYMSQMGGNEPLQHWVWAMVPHTQRQSHHIHDFFPW